MKHIAYELLNVIHILCWMHSGHHGHSLQHSKHVAEYNKAECRNKRQHFCWQWIQSKSHSLTSEPGLSPPPNRRILGRSTKPQVLGRSCVGCSYLAYKLRKKCLYWHFFYHESIAWCCASMMWLCSSHYRWVSLCESSTGPQKWIPPCTHLSLACMIHVILSLRVSYTICVI